MNIHVDGLIKKCKDHFSLSDLRPKQREVIESYLKGENVLFCSPTGSGKSLTFELAPYIFKLHEYSKHATVVVISPLVALMKNQTKKCSNLGLSAIYLSEVESDQHADKSLASTLEKLTIADIKAGEADIIFTSPESILGKYRYLVAELDKKKILKAIFIDEVHCVTKLGMVKLKSQQPFRPSYGQLGELRSMTSVPVIGLTATATEKTRNILKQKLCLRQCKEITVSPNKLNIKYWIFEAENDIEQDFKWLVHLLKECGVDCPRMLIFFHSIKLMGALYEYLEAVLTEEEKYINYSTGDHNDDRNRIFDMYNRHTDEEVKNTICESYMQEKGFKRVVLASTSFSMGLAVQGVGHVIHYGPSYDIEDYLQETGRAGRDNSTQAHAILIKYKRCLSGKMAADTCMRQYCKSQSCRRMEILKHFGLLPVPVEPKHLCCDVCAEHCQCHCLCQEQCKCTDICMKAVSRVVQVMKSRLDSDSETDLSNSGQSSNSSFQNTDLDSDSSLENTHNKPVVLIDSGEDSP